MELMPNGEAIFTTFDGTRTHSYPRGSPPTRGPDGPPDSAALQPNRCDHRGPAAVAERLLRVLAMNRGWQKRCSRSPRAENSSSVANPAADSDVRTNHDDGDRGRVEHAVDRRAE